MNGMYWITKSRRVVQQVGGVIDSNGTPKIDSRNVPTGGRNGRLRLDRLRPATPHEVARAVKP